MPFRAKTGSKSGDFPQRGPKFKEMVSDKLAVIVSRNDAGHERDACASDGRGYIPYILLI